MTRTVYSTFTLNGEPVEPKGHQVLGWCELACGHRIRTGDVPGEEAWAVCPYHHSSEPVRRWWPDPVDQAIVHSMLGPKPGLSIEATCWTCQGSRFEIREHGVTNVTSTTAIVACLGCGSRFVVRVTMLDARG